MQAQSVSTQNQNPNENRKTTGLLFIGLLLSGSACLAFFFLKDLDVAQVWDAFSRLSALATLSALAFVLVQVLLQGSRFWYLLPRAVRPTWPALFSAFSIGQWVNLFAPARAGDVMKVLLLSSSEREQRLSVMDSTASLIADKLVDLLGLILLLLIARPPLPAFSVGREAGAVLGVSLAGLLLIFAFWGKVSTRYPAVEEGRFKLLKGLRVLLDPRVLTGSLLLSVLAWLAECCALNCLAGALGYRIPLHGLVATLAILNLGIAIPLTFANLGPFEAAMAFSLGQFEVPLAEALAIASVHHILQMTGVTILAFLSWLGSGKRARDMELGLGVSSGDKSKALQYYAGMAGQYNFSVEKGLLKPLRRRERGMVLKFAGLTTSPGTSGSMIDVGCGGGFYALAAKQAGFRVCAVDAVAEMVNSLRGRVDRVEVADVESMTSVEKYDVVVCAGVLDFTKDPVLAFRNLCSLVSPGGRLVVLAPRSGLGGFIYRIEKWCAGISVNCFSSAWWNFQARANGFELARLGHPLPTNSVVEFRRPS